MDFELTEEQAMLRETVARFTRENCDDELFRRMDEEEYYPQALYRQLGELGLLAIPLPEAYGGSGLGAVECALFQEELSKRLLPLQMTFQVSILSAGMSILGLGTDIQRQAFLPKLVGGDFNICIAFSEPTAGSDAASIRVSAVPDGPDHYRLNGQKIWITAADLSDYMLISTRTDRDAPNREGISTFLLDCRSEGLTIRRIKKLGVKANPYCEVFLDNVRVPAENMLNGLNQGWAVVTHTLELDRIGAAARWVGLAQEALDYGMAYARERQQFGRPISRFQPMRERFAELQTRVDAARLLTYRAASMLDAGRPCRKEASMAKLYASEMVVELTREMLQVLGGAGYAMEYHAQRFLRDSLFATIGAGTSEIQKLIISSEMDL